jgi:hypothetical protein
VNNKHKLIVGVTLALFSLQSWAVTDCTGTVNGALLYADGSVNILGSWRNDYTVICNTNGTFGNVAPEICLAWYATALKAVGTTRQVNIYYAATHTCATLPTYWSAPAPTYFGSF